MSYNTTSVCAQNCMNTCGICARGVCYPFYNSCIGANCVNYFRVTTNPEMNTCINTANVCIKTFLY